MANQNYQSIGAVEDLRVLADMPTDLIPGIKWSTSEYATPLSPAQLRDFGSTINPLSISSLQASEGKSTSLVQSQQSDDWFLLMRVGVLVQHEPKQFAVNGADIARPVNPSPTPQFPGTIGPAGLITGNTGGGQPVDTVDVTARYAQLEWGEPTLQAANAFLNAYRLQMILNGKFVLFDESAANIGACVSGDTLEGYGTSNIAATRYIRSVNDRAQQLGTGRVFIPQTTVPVAGAQPLAAPPTLVPEAHGGLVKRGLFSGWYPTNGVFLYPGMPLQLSFIREPNETLYYDRMIDNLAQHTAITYDANLTEAIAQGAGQTTIGFSSVVPYFGGIFKIGVLMGGVTLAPKACLQAYKNMGLMFAGGVQTALYGALGAQLIQQAASAFPGAGMIGSLDQALGLLDNDGPMGLPAAR